MKRRLAAITAVGVITLAGCGGSDKAAAPKTVPYTPPVSSASTTPTPTPSVSPAAVDVSIKNVAAFMEGIHGNTTASLAKVNDLVASGSPAAQYVTYLTQSTAAYEDLNRSQPITRLNKIADDHYQFCASATVSGGTDSVGGTTSPTPDTCLDFTDFEVTSTGQIVSLKIGGEDIRTRLGKPGGTASVSGITVTITGAYRTASGFLYITATLKNESGVDFSPSDGNNSFQGADGISKSPQTLYPNVVRSGATVRILFVVQGSRTPGQIFVGGYLKNETYANVVVQVPVG